jgi:hypothetical protein
MTVVSQVHAQVFCSSHVDEVIRIRGGGSVFNLDRDYDHLSNADISEVLSLDDEHEDNNAGEYEVMPPLANSNNSGRGKKNNNAARFAAAISKDPQSPKALNPKALNPKISAKTSDFKVDAERELQNITKQASPCPNMVYFELDIIYDVTPLTDVLIKYHCGGNDKTCVLKENITLYYLVDEAMHKWCDGADTENPDVRDMAGEVRCIFYMVNECQVKCDVSSTW